MKEKQSQIEAEGEDDGGESRRTGGGLLRVRLEGSLSLVGEGLTTSVRHYE